MRIDAYQQVQQVFSTKQTQKLLKGQKAGFQDQLQISTKGKDIQVAKQAVDSTPDVREELVAALKNDVQAGTYKVGADAFATRLFERYNELNVGSF